MRPQTPDPALPKLERLSIAIPARDEEQCVASTVEHLHLELALQRGGGVIDYPRFKLRLNWLVNFGIRMLFGIWLNDTTNAFKAYRRRPSTAAGPSSLRTSTSRSSCR